MDGTHTRQVEAADLSAVRDLVFDLGYEIDMSVLESTLRAILANPNSLVVVHEVDGNVDGLIALSFRHQLHRTGLTATIDELVTRHDRRGLGIGRALVLAAIEEAAKRDAERIELTTRRSRASYERKFYESCGFVESPSVLFRMVL